MISIITCSISPEMQSELKENIDITIGVKHEFIAFDNRERKWGICKVYNYCASLSKYTYLCFVHEDMYFHTQNWGQELVKFYQNNYNVGVIGFSGSDIVPKDFVEWNINRFHSKTYITFADKISLPMSSFKRFFNYKNDYEPVIVLDGMFLFVSKMIWNENRFDEFNYNNFHIYDTDFSFSVSRHYLNYVCSKILATHRCHSKLNNIYIDGLHKFRNKWRHEIPTSLNRSSVIINILTRYQQFYKNHMLYKKNGYSLSMTYKQLKKSYKNINTMYLLMIFHRYISIFTNIKIRRF